MKIAPIHGIPLIPLAETTGATTMELIISMDRSKIYQGTMVSAIPHIHFQAARIITPSWNHMDK